MTSDNLTSVRNEVSKNQHFAPTLIASPVGNNGGIMTESIKKGKKND